MKTDYVIDDTMVGSALPVPDGFLVGLRQTQNQSRYEVPFWDNGRGVWRSGYFVLKGDRDHQAVFSACPGQGGTVDPAKTWVANRSIKYHGNLIVVAVPAGSTWALTLSDIPNTREAPAAWPTWYENIRDRQRERELVLR
jgi:hypothetical protein